MIRASLLALFSTLIICGFCGKEFVSLGRHSWRCKSKVDYGPEIRNSDIPTTEIHTQEYLPVKSSKSIKCCCGKVCKEARGLKMHQRCCRVIDDLEQEIQEEMTELLTEQNEDIIESNAPPVNSQEDFPDLRKGIKLPTSPSQWTTANEFFKLTFSNHPITAHDLNNNITTMTTVVYNYFSENFGYANNTNSAQYERKYRTSTTKDSKKTLKKLKLENGDV